MFLTQQNSGEDLSSLINQGAGANQFQNDLVQHQLIT